MRDYQIMDKGGLLTVAETAISTLREILNHRLDHIQAHCLEGLQAGDLIERVRIELLIREKGFR